jgi:hypothetical protein
VAAVNVRLPGGPASRGGDASHAVGRGVADVAAAVAAAAGVPASRVNVTRLIEDATEWAVALPLAPGTRLWRRQRRQLEAAAGGGALLAGPPLGSAQAATWRYVAVVSLASAPGGGGATATPLSALHASLRDRVQSAAAAPAWSALASSWAAASGQSASDVLAQLAVTVSQPAATPVPDREAVNAGVLAGAVVGAVVLLGLLVACGLAAITRQRAKYRTGLGIPAVVMWGVTGPSSGSGDPRVI